MAARWGVLAPARELAVDSMFALVVMNSREIDRQGNTDVVAAHFDCLQRGADRARRARGAQTLAASLIRDTIAVR
jgi:hypothetical protein